MKPALHLLIIHYNNPDVLERTLACFLENGFEAARITVLDNGSSQVNKDEMARLAERHQVDVTFLEENLGWGGAINRFVSARAWSENDLLGIAAHDAILRKSDWTALEEEFSDERILFVCPQYPIPLLCEFSVSRSFRCKSATDAERWEVLVGHATLCFARPTILARLPFDEYCFIYGCESEIFLRAHDAGFKTVVTSRIIVENPVTDTSSEFRTLAFAINSVYIARLRRGLLGYFVRMLVVAVSAMRLMLQGNQIEGIAKSKALLFSLRTGGAGFKEYLRWKA